MLLESAALVNTPFYFFFRPDGPGSPQAEAVQVSGDQETQGKIIIISCNLFVFLFFGFEHLSTLQLQVEAIMSRSGLVKSFKYLFS